MNKFLWNIFGGGIKKLFRYALAIFFLFYFCNGNALLHTELDAVKMLSSKALELWKEAERHSAANINNAYNTEPAGIRNNHGN
jgi:hypothetical protein